MYICRYIGIHIYIFCICGCACASVNLDINIWYPPPGTYPFIYTSLSFYVGCGPGERGCLKSTPIQAPTPVSILSEAFMLVVVLGRGGALNLPRFRLNRSDSG